MAVIHTILFCFTGKLGKLAPELSINIYRYVPEPEKESNNVTVPLKGKGKKIQIKIDSNEFPLIKRSKNFKFIIGLNKKY